MNMTKKDTLYCLNQFREVGIENILALRGDKVEEKSPCDDFPHASDLIEFIKEYDSNRKDGKYFKIFGACYPELHPQSTSVYDDIDNLKKKVDAGASHLLSQLFLIMINFIVFKNDV